jgi:hypothetical protein
MEIVFPSYSGYDNLGSTFYCSMVKQKLELTFWNGFLLGALFTFFICSGIVDKFFVSKEVFNLKTIYVNGKLYNLCRVR